MHHPQKGTHLRSVSRSRPCGDTVQAPGVLAPCHADHSLLMQQTDRGCGDTEEKHCVPCCDFESMVSCPSGDLWVEHSASSSNLCTDSHGSANCSGNLLPECCPDVALFCGSEFLAEHCALPNVMCDASGCIPEGLPHCNEGDCPPRVNSYCRLDACGQPWQEEEGTCVLNHADLSSHTYCEDPGCSSSVQLNVSLPICGQEQSSCLQGQVLHCDLLSCHHQYVFHEGSPKHLGSIPNFCDAQSCSEDAACIGDVCDCPKTPASMCRLSQPGGEWSSSPSTISDLSESLSRPLGGSTQQDPSNLANPMWIAPLNGHSVELQPTVPNSGAWKRCMWITNKESNDLCGYCCQGSDQLQNHLEQCHIKAQPSERYQPGCRVCSWHGCEHQTQQKTFRQVQHLKEHVMRHTGWQGAQCSVCGQRLVNNSALKDHMRIHTNERPYKCDTCGNAFRTLGTLYSHQRAMHSGEKPYTCTHCGKMFADSGNFAKHKATHEDPKFACDICGKGFKRKQNMVRHKGERASMRYDVPRANEL